jgi:hypothetical protein
MLSASHSTTFQLSASKFRNHRCSLIIPLAKVMQKSGKAKNIKGRSSAKILLREIIVNQND